MEEAIKILKEERDKLYGELECDAYDGDEEMTQHFTAKYNALNNILNKLEQNERVIEEMANYINENEIFLKKGEKEKLLSTYSNKIKKQSETLYDVHTNCIKEYFRKKCE